MSFQKKGLPKWAIPVIAVLIVAIITVVLFLTGVFTPKSVEVPNIVNMSIDEAQNVIKEAGLSICITQREINDDIDENTVLLQSPESGIKIAKGATVNVTVSEKSIEVTVPDVVYYKKDLAVKILQNSGFKVEIIEKQTEEFADGSVMSQSITGKGKTGSTIILTVAKNSKSESDEMIKVPSVVGKTLNEAREIFDGKFYIIVEEEEFSDSVKKGGIILQKPIADVEAKIYTTVNVIISKGKASDAKVTVPSVTLTTRSQAKTMLENLGLKVVIKEQHSETVAAGVVISQSVPKGKVVKPGTTVTITVSKGKATSETEDTEKMPTYTKLPTSKRNETTTKKNSSSNITNPNPTTPSVPTTKPADSTEEKKYVADFKITTDKETVSAGDIITVSVKLKTNYKIVSVSLPVIYDSRVFEVVGADENNVSSFLNFTGTLTKNAYSTNGNWKSPDSMYTKNSNTDHWTSTLTKNSYKIAFATWVAMPSQGTQLTSLKSEETIVTFKLKVKANVRDTSGRIFMSPDFIKTASDPQGILSVGRAKSDQISVDNIVATGQTINLKEATVLIKIN